MGFSVFNDCSERLKSLKSQGYFGLAILRIE